MFRGVVIIGMSIVVPAFAVDWPQWRGPHRTGMAVQADLPTVWPKEAPAPLWQVKVGEGFSSPVIVDGRVYILGREEGDKETCLCLDAATGKEVWKHAYAAPHEPHPAARAAGKGPRSTPTVDGDRVYMLGVNGLFHCFEARTGKVLWKHDFQAEYWGVEKAKDGYDAWATYCGAAASPLIDGDRVVLPVGGKKAGAMTAFDKHTGKLVWKNLDDRSSYASPMLTELAGVKQVVGFTGLRMAGFDAADGTLLWEYPYKVSYEQTIVTPVLWKDLVLVCGEGKPLTALRVEKQDGKVSMSVAWQNKALRSYMSTPVVFKDHLLGLDDSGQLVCINLATGKTAWAKGNFGEHVSIVVAGDQLLVLHDSGELTVLEANPQAYTLKAQWELSKEGKSWTQLAVVGSRLYVKDKQHLTCFDSRSGSR